MKPEELRVGNYILGQYYDTDDETELYELCKVLALDSVGESEYPIWVDGLDRTGTEYYDTFEAIPLTEEWLLKFGGEKRTGRERGFWFIIEEYEICISENYLGNGWFISIKTGFGSQSVTVLKSFVHEWQNLYYSLTGKELKI